MRAIGGVALIALGILLGSAGLLFRLMHWPDAFRGSYTGPLLIVAGLMWLVVQAARPAAAAAPAPQRLHSGLTYWVKYGSPALVLLMLLTAAALAARGGMPADAAGPVLGLLVVLLAANLGFGALLQLAHRRGDTLYVGRYQARRAYPLQVWQQKEPVVANLYRIRTPDGHSRYVLTRLTNS